MSNLLLVVEDEQALRKKWSVTQLKAEGFQVIEVADGQEGLASVWSEKKARSGSARYHAA
jgi:DNA-binding response OmpR family regulator